MSKSKTTVLITGCSDNSLGAALSIAFHEAGHHVYATARDPAKMKSLEALGIETLTLDVLSEASIAECVRRLPALDILVNNAGCLSLMPVADLDISEAKKTFDLNVWSYIAVTQAFLPLLLKSSHPMIVNQTSISSVTTVPFQGVYTASKAAAAALSDTLRLELQAFGVKVVDLRTGIVKTNLIKNHNKSDRTSLPEGSIYEPARDVVEKALRQEGFGEAGIPAKEWANGVVKDLLKKTPPPLIWRGESAMLARVGSMMPFGMFDNTVKKLVGLDVVEGIIQKWKRQ